MFKILCIKRMFKVVFIFLIKIFFFKGRYVMLVILISIISIFLYYFLINGVIYLLCV